MSSDISIGVPSTFHTHRRPINRLSEDQALKDALVKSVAKKSLTEIAVSFAFIAVTVALSASFVGVATFVLTNITILAVTTLSRVANGHLEYQCHKLTQDGSSEALRKKDLFQALQKPLKWIAPIGFSLVDVTTRNVLVHEVGHALSARAVYQNARPRIETYPGHGASTSYSAGKLTSFGKLLGWRGSDFLVTVSGVGMSLLFSIGSLFTAVKMKGDKELRMYLISTAIASIAQHAFYALSALWSYGSGHDFVVLATHGFHPILSALLIIAIPVVATLLFSELTRKPSPVPSSTHRPHLLRA